MRLILKGHIKDEYFVEEKNFCVYFKWRKKKKRGFFL